MALAHRRPQKDLATGPTDGANETLDAPGAPMCLARVLTLPAEVRLLIFEYVVAAEAVVTYQLDSFLKDTYTEAVQPALTRVSRQVRAESLPLWYACNEFVLHTEQPRADDARRWLRCNHAHLSRVCHVAFWVRYASLSVDRFGSHGAFSISMSRRPGRRKDQPHGWAVDEGWKWITVVRRPTDSASDATFLIRNLRELVDELLASDAGPYEFYGLMMDLRTAYLKNKMS